jgi:uncharacterized protein YjlB
MAGSGHQCLTASSDFLVVAAYPPSGTYEECTKSEDHERPQAPQLAISFTQTNPRGTLPK